MLGKNKGRRRPNVNVTRPNTDRETVISYRSSTSVSSNPRSTADSGRHNRNVSSESRFKRILHNLPSKIAVIAILLSAGYVTTLQTTVNLIAQSISSDHQLLRDKSTYQTAASDVLSNSIFNRNKLLINVGAFERAMATKFPELEQVSMTLPLIGHEPVVSIISKTPVLKIASPQGVFLVDAKGQAIIKASEAVRVDSWQLPSVTDESQYEISVGNGVLTAEATMFVSQFYSYLASKNIVVTSMTLPSTANELRVGIKDKPYVIRLSLDNDARQSAGEYLALVQEFGGRGVNPVEYIDLRVSERAYYK